MVLGAVALLTNIWKTEETKTLRIYIYFNKPSLSVGTQLSSGQDLTLSNWKEMVKCFTHAGICEFFSRGLAATNPRGRNRKVAE